MGVLNTTKHGEPAEGRLGHLHGAPNKNVIGELSTTTPYKNGFPWCFSRTGTHANDYVTKPNFDDSHVCRP